MIFHKLSKHIHGMNLCGNYALIAKNSILFFNLSVIPSSLYV
jgi:hypothetical protein